MGIFSRLAQLIKSNLNDLISKSEDPEKMLNQVVLDMNNQLVEAKKQVASSIADEKRLAELGYKQELNRSWSGFQNFAISFTIISILAGCLTSYAIAFNNGGPIAISWGWLLVGVRALLELAELRGEHVARVLLGELGAGFGLGLELIDPL